MSPSELVRTAERYLAQYPHAAVATLGDPRPEDLARDATYEGRYAVLPVAGSGRAIWFLETRALRDALARRFRSARPVDAPLRALGQLLTIE